MPKINSIKNINVATAGFPVYLTLESMVSRYKVYGTLALSENVSILPAVASTPKEGMVVTIDYFATVSTAKAGTPPVPQFSFNVFGTSVPESWMAKKLKIWCEYQQGAWHVYILPSMDSLKGIKLDMLSDDIVDDSTLGKSATTDKFVIKPLGVTASELAANAVTVTKVADGAITLPKLADIDPGKIIMGNATSDPTATALTGDVTVTSAGVTAIGTDKVTAAMIKDDDIADNHINSAAAISVSKLAALSTNRALVTDSSGVITPHAEVTDTEIGYLSGVTSNIQNQIDAGIAKVSHVVISSNTTPTADKLYNSYIADTTAGSVDLTLPLASTLVIGTPVRLLQIGDNAATLKPNASDKLYPVTSYTADVASVSCSGTGKSIYAILISASEWQVIQQD